MKAGAVDLLTKPVDVQDFIGAIQRAVTRDEHERASETRLAAIRRRVAMLTAREVEVFARVVTRMLNKQIGAVLGIGEKTVKAIATGSWRRRRPVRSRSWSGWPTRPA